MTAFYGHKTDCRCEPCREAHAAYMREFRARKKAGKPPVEKPTPRPLKRPETYAAGAVLRVQCWCKADDVYVSKTDLWNGITYPCSRPECETMAAKERAA